MPYAPPVDISTAFTDAELDSIYRQAARNPWAVLITDPDEIRTHIDPDLDPEDENNEEFTQRTALKWAAERNAWNDKRHAEDPNGPAGHCIVLHNGEPWVPDPNSDGPADEYCEWFDFESFDWFCNQCFNVLKDTGAHCPTCAPTRFPGLMRVPCDDESNRHPAIFMYADNTDGYSGAYCHYCIRNHQDQVQAERAHAGHRQWYRRLDLLRLLPVLKRLRLVKSWYWTSGSPTACNGCVNITWRWTR